MNYVWIVAILLPALATAAKDWWETASFYQIYPRSFQDSNGDGIGDLKGITQRLEYLKDLGVTAFWLSPIYKSPMADFGYDISDFYDIQPEYGTMADFEELVSKATTLGLKVILDFVPNHSSDENEWFIKSVNKEGKYTDYYTWHPGKPNPEGGQPLPPSNWLSLFKYSAWKWNGVRQEYYLHQFADQQPDLNYRNPDVVEQMKDVLRFWLGKGIAGFRIDAVWCLFEADKDASGNFPDEPVSGDTIDSDDPGYLRHIYTQDQPGTYDMVYQWRAVMDEWKTQHGGDTKIIMTEAYTSLDNTMRYYGNETVNGSHMPFNFQIILNLRRSSTAANVNDVIHSWMDHLPKGKSANWVMGNHDQRRVASRIGEARTDTMNMVLLTLPGASVSYMGEEIGMTDVYISWRDTVDPAACRTNETEFEKTTRDPARTPFQWDSTTSAGFSTNIKTWLPLSPLYQTVNVAAQLAASKSHLKTYKQLMQLRKDAIMQSDEFSSAYYGNVLYFSRWDLLTNRWLITLANFGDNVETFNYTKAAGGLKWPSNVKLQYKVVSDKQTQKIDDSANAERIVLQPQGAVVILGSLSQATTTTARTTTTATTITTPSGAIMLNSKAISVFIAILILKYL